MWKWMVNGRSERWGVNQSHSQCLKDGFEMVHVAIGREHSIVGIPIARIHECHVPARQFVQS